MRMRRSGSQNRDIRISPYGDSALARMQTVHLGVIGRAQRHELLQRYATLLVALRKQHRQTRFDAGMPFGTQRKLVRPFGVSLPWVSL